MIYAAQSGLGLPDREYYFKDNEASVELRVKYVEHIEKMFGLAGFDEGAAAAETIMALETRLAGQNMKKEDARNWSENYNKVALQDLPGLMPNFNWDGYLAAADIESLDAIVFFTTDYIKALDGIITDTDIDTWKTYLYWSALNNTASRLTSALDQQNFEFYGKALSGTEEQRAMWRRGSETWSTHTRKASKSWTGCRTKPRLKPSTSCQSLLPKLAIRMSGATTRHWTLKRMTITATWSGHRSLNTSALWTDKVARSTGLNGA